MVYKLRTLTISYKVSIRLFQPLLLIGGIRIFNNLLVTVLAIRNLIMLVKTN